MPQRHRGAEIGGEERERNGDVGDMRSDLCRRLGAAFRGGLRPYGSGTAGGRRFERDAKVTKTQVQKTRGTLRGRSRSPKAPASEGGRYNGLVTCGAILPRLGRSDAAPLQEFGGMVANFAGWIM